MPFLSCNLRATIVFMKTVLEERIARNMSYLSESQQRLYLATEAISLGEGGIEKISAISGVPGEQILAGMKDIQKLQEGTYASNDAGSGARKRSTGRKPIEDLQPEILDALEGRMSPLLEDPSVSPLRWTTQSMQVLTKELKGLGFAVQKDKVEGLLRKLGYDVPPAQKGKKAGPPAAVIDQQFEFLTVRTISLVEAQEPVLFIECKKKGKPEEGTGSEVWETVGVTEETAFFAGDAISSWWNSLGRKQFPKAQEILLTVVGGEDGPANQLWRERLIRLSDDLKLELSIGHLPPAIWKWNQKKPVLSCRFCTDPGEVPVQDYRITVYQISCKTWN